MLQTLRNRRNRKGFTLAELLIVVAIIAVLVAIAVPLFVGALNDAEKRVMDANKRAVRGAAVEEILMNKNKGTANDLLYNSTSKSNYAIWGVKAYIGTNGQVDYLSITPDVAGGTKVTTTLFKEDDSKKLTADDVKAEGGTHSAHGKDGGYYIVLIIDELKLS